jgi:hypothetical protein
MTSALRLQLVRRLRIPALLCALSVLLCDLIARPFASMSVCDDGPYILMAQHLAATGHIVYNGGATAMLGWQLYLGAAFIKLFGFSFTAVRMSTVLVAMATAFLLQRIMVRSNITERNATLGTLALVLSPLSLMLTATYMTDITGLFAVVVCLYSCIRALQSTTSRSTILWLCFAVLSNALCGTSRQIAWLGILVIVPSTLWLLRAQRRGPAEYRRILIAGAAATLAGVVFLFACMHWFSRQPYILPEPLLPKSFSLSYTLGSLVTFYLDLPFLLLALTALFLPQLRSLRPRILALLSVLFLGYLFLATYPSHLRGHFPLEPMLHNGNWVSVHGIYEGVISLSDWHSQTPIFLTTPVCILLTLVSIGGLLGLLASLRRTWKTPAAPTTPNSLTWHQLTILLAPFTLAYMLLLLPRSTGLLFDRYALELLLVAAIVLVRYYQDRIHPNLPFSATLLVAVMAIYAIAVTHNTFSLDRARLALAAELNANGVPDTSVDNGWEYNFDVEIHQAGYLNDARILLPAHAYTPTPPPPPGICHTLFSDATPHIHPLYGISFQPNVCNGPAPFAPVHYSRWLASTPGTLYAVRYTPASKP